MGLRTLRELNLRERRGEPLHAQNASNQIVYFIMDVTPMHVSKPATHLMLVLWVAQWLQDPQLETQNEIL